MPGTGRQGGERSQMTQGHYKDIPVGQVDISPDNVRKRSVREGLEGLAENIRDHGLLQPIVVQRKGGRYKLIIGQRRFLACTELLGWTKIPARVVKVEGSTGAAVLSLSENIHRANLDYRDKMAAAVDLLTKLGSAREVARALNVAETTVRDYLGYVGVPEPIKKLVSQRRISARTATQIARSVPEEQEAVRIAKAYLETTRGDSRRAFMATVRENPGRSTSEIKRLASKQVFRRFTIHLTSRVSDALEEACGERAVPPAELARYALEEWLKEERFL